MPTLMRPPFDNPGDQPGQRPRSSPEGPDTDWAQVMFFAVFALLMLTKTFVGVRRMIQRHQMRSSPPPPLGSYSYPPAGGYVDGAPQGFRHEGRQPAPPPYTAQSSVVTAL